MDTGEILRDVGRRLSRLRIGAGDDVRLLVDLDVPHARCCTLLEAGGDRLPVDDIPQEALDALRLIRSEMVEAGGERWSRCVYILRPDGTFHLGIEYPAIA